MISRIATNLSLLNEPLCELLIDREKPSKSIKTFLIDKLFWGRFSGEIDNSINEGLDSDDNSEALDFDMGGLLPSGGLPFSCVLVFGMEL